MTAEPDVAVSQAQTLLTVRGGPAADPHWLAWLDLIETIVVYKLPHLSREEIQRMHLPDIELKQTRFCQNVFAEGHAEGRAEPVPDGPHFAGIEGMPRRSVRDENRWQPAHGRFS